MWSILTEQGKAVWILQGSNILLTTTAYPARHSPVLVDHNPLEIFLI